MGEHQIGFEKFMNDYKERYLTRLEHAEGRSYEIDDDGENISSFMVEVIRQKRKFVRENADFIVLSENLIDELMGYIKESIEMYGLNYMDFYNETFFIREVLNQMIDNMRETSDESINKKMERLETFLAFFQLNEYEGFCKEIEGHISSTDGVFSIATHNLKLVCKIDQHGINQITTNELDDEDLLIADKMYVGYLTGNDNSLFIFLEKMINGERKMKAITYDQNIYDILGEKQEGTHKTISMFKRAVLFGKINDFYEKIGLSVLKSNIYTKNSLREMIEAFNRLNKMSLDEREELENIIEIAVSWWVNAGLKEDTSLKKNQAKEIQKFKSILANKVRIMLLSRAAVGLSVDYRPEGELADAIKESKITASFPLKTSMFISKDVIRVGRSDSTSKEVIYSKEKEANKKRY